MHLKYIELLEKRINQLEALVSKTSDAGPKPPDHSASAESGENVEAKIDASTKVPR